MIQRVWIILTSTSRKCSKCYTCVTAILQSNNNSLHNDKEKLSWNQFNQNYLKKQNKKQVHTSLSVNSVCSILCWLIFGSSYSLQCVWIQCDYLGTLSFGRVLSFFFVDPLKPPPPQVGWRDQAGPLKDIHRAVLKSVFSYLGCVLLLSSRCLHRLPSSFPCPWLVSQFLLIKNMPTPDIPVRHDRSIQAKLFLFF